MKRSRITPAKLKHAEFMKSQTLARQLRQALESRDQFRENARFYREQADANANAVQYAEDKASECMDLRRELHWARMSNKVVAHRVVTTLERAKGAERRSDQHYRDAMWWRAIAICSSTALAVSTAVSTVYVFSTL